MAECLSGAAPLFTSAKVSHLGMVPHGQPERLPKVGQMVAQVELETFGNGMNHRECATGCLERGLNTEITRG